MSMREKKKKGRVYGNIEREVIQKVELNQEKIKWIRKRVQ